VLAPIFFGIVGLTRDLWDLGGGGYAGHRDCRGLHGSVRMLARGYGAGLRFWEAASIAVAMNARAPWRSWSRPSACRWGSFAQMFSIIVMVANRDLFPGARRAAPDDAARAHDG
jgi:hypothetical protein